MWKTQVGLMYQSVSRLFQIHLTFSESTFPYEKLEGDYTGGSFLKKIAKNVSPVNSHLARVGFPKFLAGDDLEEAEQLAAVRQVGEEVVDLHLGLQQEAVHPFCERLLLDV